MAHFASLDENNIVTNVVWIGDEWVTDDDGNEIEQLGIDKCVEWYGGKWIQTSYNNNFRVRYAGIGYRYDDELDAFIAPCIYPSWTLVGANWEPPVEYPNPDTTQFGYWWNEEQLEWVERIPPKQDDTND